MSTVYPLDMFQQMPSPYLGKGSHTVVLNVPRFMVKLSSSGAGGKVLTACSRPSEEEGEELGSTDLCEGRRRQDHYGQ